MANLQAALKKEKSDLKDMFYAPKRDNLSYYEYKTGFDMEKILGREEKSLSANPKPVSRHSCNLHPLQIHLLISVTMILLTHRYPQIVVLV